MSCAWPTSSCTFAVSASLRWSVGARRIHSRSGSTPISSEFPCISMNLRRRARYSSGIQSSVSTWPPDCTYSRNPCSCSVIRTPPNRTIVRVRSVVAASTVGLLHPGEMGAAVGAVLRERGLRVLWASEGRSPETRKRAEAAGLEDACSAKELAGSGVLLSVCPPHAVLDVARSVGRFEGLYVDANAVAPATAHKVAELVRTGGGELVDGGIVGSPPREAGTTRLYLSGAQAGSIRELFAG